MTHAIRSQGSSKIKWGGAAPAETPTRASIATAAAAVTTWLDVDEASEIKQSGQKVTEIDVTHLMSGAKEFMLGIEDSGTIDLTGNWTGSTAQQQLMADKNSKQLSIYQVQIGTGVLTNPVTFSFYAYVVEFMIPDVKVDGKVDLQAKLRISGPVAIDYGSLTNPTF